MGNPNGVARIVVQGSGLILKSSDITSKRFPQQNLRFLKRACGRCDRSYCRGEENRSFVSLCKSVEPYRSRTCMSILIILLRSLLLTSVLSFLAPLLVFGILLLSLSLSAHLPGLELFCCAGETQVKDFLATFGSGQPVEGLLVISCTCSIVGILFDSYAFYRDQILHSN